MFCCLALRCFAPLPPPPLFSLAGAVDLASSPSPSKASSLRDSSPPPPSQVVEVEKWEQETMVAVQVARGASWGGGWMGEQVVSTSHGKFSQLQHGGQSAAWSEK